MKNKPRLSDEMRRIPIATKILAALIPLCVIAVFFLIRTTTSRPVTVPPRGGPGVAAVMFLIVPLISVVVSIWVLLVGYVYADAGRRGMNRLLWMLVVIFVPNALGFILYFLLRHPVPRQCPGCGGSLDDNVAFCPQCGVQVARSCPKCTRMIGVSDKFCSSCGANLTETAQQTG